jgi:transcriptional antiterminator RfaH
MDSLIEDDLTCWYVIHTHPKQEARADLNLRAEGVETLYPKIKERRYNQFTGSLSFVTKALFPRYIFARFAAKKSHGIYYTRGVHSVVRFGPSPARIDNDVIELIKSRMDETGLVNINEELSAGDKVVIKNGPLKSFMGIFERQINASDRVMILLTAINYQGHIFLEKESVEKIS